MKLLSLLPVFQNQRSHFNTWQFLLLRSNPQQWSYPQSCFKPKSKSKTQCCCRERLGSMEMKKLSFRAKNTVMTNACTKIYIGEWKRPQKISPIATEYWGVPDALVSSLRVLSMMGIFVEHADPQCGSSLHFFQKSYSKKQLEARVIFIMVNTNYG